MKQTTKELKRGKDTRAKDWKKDIKAYIMKARKKYAKNEHREETITEQKK
jgi:hypothetical protein